MYEGSLSYVVDQGDFRFIQVNYYPWFENTFKAYLDDAFETKEFKLYSSMTWLENRLKEVASGSKVIVIHAHYIDEDKKPDFFDLCERYEVAAIFMGHRHDLVAKTYRGIRMYRCGAGFFKSFVVAEYHKESNHLAVYFAKNGVIDRATDHGGSSLYVLATPKIDRISREMSRFTVSIQWPVHAERVELVFYRDGIDMPMDVYMRGEALRVLDVSPSRLCKVKLRFVSYRGRRGPWTPITDVPDYSGDLPSMPTDLWVENGGSLRDSVLHWARDPKDHGYVVKVAPGRNSLGGLVLTSLPPYCHTQDSVALSKLTGTPESYRGQYFKVMSTTHENVWSEPGLLLVDDVLDALALSAQPPSQDMVAKRACLLGEHASLMERLIEIERQLEAYD